MPSSPAYTAKCTACGRIRHFRTAEAAASAKPYGRICSVRVRLAAIAEAVKGFTAEQAEKARQLIADGGLIATNRDGIYFAVSSDGKERYRVSVTGHCTCPAGRWMRTLKPCYHVAGARAVLAATGKAA